MGKQRISACGFCGKRKKDVFQIIQGAETAICDGCVCLCMTAIAEVNLTHFGRLVEKTLKSVAPRRLRKHASRKKHGDS
jgi:ATP-dependent protease Clp ATPase subunit